MEKQEVIREMKAFVGGSSYITANALARHLGKSKGFTKKLITGLDKIPGDARGTKYFIPEVAQRIMEEKRQ
ncbi:hypothetical protein LI177_02740 [bacterium 210820-DFI.6.37]|nr:hypothetical protein [bacterium 210820-DFI.6.37]